MTALGGLAHTLPFLVPSFTVVITIAAAVVVVELLVIAWIRNRYMDTPLVPAALQVVGGGMLVFATGVAIGSG
jgi:erythrin-vacuolar iron transport family protein